METWVNESGNNWIIWLWYGFMLVVCALGNMVLLRWAWLKIDVYDDYGKKMKMLGVPWVWECAWRSIFLSLYLQRFVFWDTPLNSILVDRTWAFVGELSWVMQVTLALRHIDTEVTGGKAWIQISAWVAFFVYIVAEGTSYYNTATTNELWAAIEVFLDGVSYLVMAPAAVYLSLICPGGILESSAKTYLVAMSLICIVYPLYNFFLDVPMYLSRYQEDEAAGKVYFDFIDGLMDAATTRNKTHLLGDWNADMFWMTVYFSFGAWSGILLMFAPRLMEKTHSQKNGASLEPTNVAIHTQGDSSSLRMPLIKVTLHSQ